MYTLKWVIKAPLTLEYFYPHGIFEWYTPLFFGEAERLMHSTHGGIEFNSSSSPIETMTGHINRGDDYDL